MKKKLMVCLLVLSMIVISFAGCAKSDKPKNGNGDASGNNQTTGSDKKEDEGKDNEGVEATDAPSKYQTTYGSKMFDNVTITVELFDRSNAPEGSTITENRWTKYAQDEMKKVGINLEFVPVPRGDEITKMQTMMASGTSPDITITYSYANVEQYLKDGGVWDLSEFINGSDQALNMKAYLGEDVLNIGRTPDNKLFGIVAKRATTASTNLFVRKDWLDALKLPIPTTPDELYNVIYKMKYENPDARSTTIGAIPWMSYNLRQAFSKLGDSEKENAIAKGNDAVTEYYDQGSREYYRFLNKLYNAGLMNQEYYTMTQDVFNSYIVTGDVAFFEANVNYAVDVMRGSLLKTLQENVPTADIVSIPPLKNIYDGNQYSSAYGAGGLAAFCPLTADETKVEAAMTYLDWMCSKEGGFVFYHGFEGEHFDYNDAGVPVVKDSAYNSKDKDWIRADVFLVGNQGYFSTVDDFNACTALEAPGYEDYVIENYENALKGIVFHDPTYTSPSTADLITDITIVRDEYKVSVVTCPVDKFDATYDEYLSELEAVGIKTIIEERTEYYNSVYGN